MFSNGINFLRIWSFTLVLSTLVQRYVLRVLDLLITNALITTLT